MVIDLFSLPEFLRCPTEAAGHLGSSSSSSVTVEARRGASKHEVAHRRAEERGD